MGRWRLFYHVKTYFPLSVSHSELQSEQRADPSLEELFGSVLAAVKVKNVASGYFLQDGILVRKWVPHGEDFVGDPIFCSNCSSMPVP